MQQVSHALTEQEIQALASYIQGLHDRASDAKVVAAASQP
jgi:mono/diheme cytochrome c family protein